MIEQPQCVSCGKFIKLEKGVAWRMVYSGAVLYPDREIYRCKNCIKKFGEFETQAGIKPECSCGIIGE